MQHAAGMICSGYQKAAVVFSGYPVPRFLEYGMATACLALSACAVMLRQRLSAFPVQRAPPQSMRLDGFVCSLHDAIAAFMAGIHAFNINALSSLIGTFMGRSVLSL